jgi:hypothetical protein
MNTLRGSGEIDMQGRDFCFWLQGFFELNEHAGEINEDQASLIRRHLDLVFAHENAASLRERPVDAPKPVPAPPLPEPVRENPPEQDRPVVPVNPPRC